MSAIDEIKARIDIVDLVQESVQLRRSGKNYVGFCPFHPNTRTPAFAVFPDSGTWRCFGQCNEGGDIFKFIMKKENVEFSEALRYLAERAGVELKPLTPEEREVAEEHDALRALLEEAVTFYRHQLLQTSAGEPALNYLKQQRALRLETLEAFGLGYAPNAWDAVLQHFTSRGYSLEDLHAVGLTVQGEGGRVYDRFRNRIMIPVRDERGRMAGFGARVLDPQDVPKFLNSPQTDIFDKGRLLFGLDRARQAIRKLDQAIVVEGYFDVIALHQAGFENVVSPMGTALTEQQLVLLKRFSRRIILAMDADAAGEQATLRGLQVARRSFERESEAVFDARGLLRFEGRLKADIRVAVLPESKDPDEVVHEGAHAWMALVERAQPIVLHVMETLARSKNLEDAKVKSEIAAQVLPLIEDVADPIERDAYRQRLARLLRVDERTLLSRRVKRRDSSQPVRVAKEGLSEEASSVEVLKSAQARSYALEAYCLGILLRKPELLVRVDRLLQEEKLSRFSSADFQHADHQTIFRLIQESIDQDVAEPLDYVMHHMTLELMEISEALLQATSGVKATGEKAEEDGVRALLELRKRNLRQSLEYQYFLMQLEQEKGDYKSTQSRQSMVQLNQQLGRLEVALKKHISRLLNQV